MGGEDFSEYSCQSIRFRQLISYRRVDPVEKSRQQKNGRCASLHSSKFHRFRAHHSHGIIAMTSGLLELMKK